MSAGTKGRYANCMTVNNTSMEALSFQAERSKLDTSLVKSIAWTGGMKWLTQLLSWSSTLIVVRILSPEDYGLVGMSAIYMALATIFNEFGLGLALVTQRDLTDQEVGQFNTLSLLLGSFNFGVSCVAATALSQFFSAPQLRWVVMAMSLNFLITAFQTVPHALLQRDLRFKLLAVLEGIQGLTISISMLLLALLGMGYWALVLAALIGNTLLAAMTVANRPHCFSVPRLHPLRRTLTLSWHILVSRFTWYIQTNTDFLLVGRLLGQRALGLYTLGYTLASVPMDKITALVGRVTPAFFSAVQHDRTALRRYFSLLTEALALTNFAVGFGLTLVADDFVRLVLGDKWAAAVAPLQLLGISTAIRSTIPLLPHVLNVTGMSKFNMRYGIYGAVVMPIGFYLGSYFGMSGIAATWCLIYPLVSLPFYWRVFAVLGLSAGDYLRSIWPALSGSLMMVGAVLVTRLAVSSGSSLLLRFSLEVAAGAAGYLLTLVVFHRRRLLAAREILHMLLR